MTLTEYQELNQDAQETFINEGGTIDTSSTNFSSAPLNELPHNSLVESKGSTGSVHPVVEPEKETPLEQEGLSSPSFPLVESSSLYSDGFDIADPVELLFMLDENIQRGASNGGVDLHPWQVQFMLDFAAGGINDKNPFQAIVRACNGSGKDKYIIAPCVVWLCMRYKKALGVVTSASGVQLDNQTCRYIKQLCEAVNSKFRHEIWQCKYRSYACHFNDNKNDISQIFCYATDEAGKAEGYHPTDFGTKMGIFVSEDKSVSDEINVALNKCTGYTHRVHVSTPGLPMGHFFDYDATSIPRDTITSVLDVSTIDWIRYLVTAYQCSHISAQYIEQMKRDLPGGEFGAAFKSQVLAEFGTTDEMTVVPYIYVSRALNNKTPWLQETYNTGGLDLSLGGAETVLCVRNGNRLLKIIPFKFDNSEDTIDFLEDQFEKNGLNHREALVFADCCGIGAPMINSLKRKGWSNLRYVDSRHKSREPKVYSNVATELFFNVRKLLEREELIIPRDDLLIRQLATRYYKMNVNNIHALLTKLEQRAKGYPSPDRADAFNLCFWNYKSTSPKEVNKENEIFKNEPARETEKVVGDFDMKSWARGINIKSMPTEHCDIESTSLREELEQYNMRLNNSRN